MLWLSFISDPRLIFLILTVQVSVLCYASYLSCAFSSTLEGGTRAHPTQNSRQYPPVPYAKLFIMLSLGALLNISSRASHRPLSQI